MAYRGHTNIQIELICKMFASTRQDKKIEVKCQENRARMGQFYEIYNNCISLFAGDLKFYKYATWMYIQPNQCTKSLKTTHWCDICM